MVKKEEINKTVSKRKNWMKKKYITLWASASTASLFCVHFKRPSQADKASFCFSTSRCTTMKSADWNTEENKREIHKQVIHCYHHLTSALHVLEGLARAGKSQGSCQTPLSVLAWFLRLDFFPNTNHFMV